MGLGFAYWINGRIGYTGVVGYMDSRLRRSACWHLNGHQKAAATTWRGQVSTYKLHMYCIAGVWRINTCVLQYVCVLGSLRIAIHAYIVFANHTNIITEPPCAGERDHTCEQRSAAEQMLMQATSYQRNARGQSAARFIK